MTIQAHPSRSVTGEIRKDKKRIRSSYIWVSASARTKQDGMGKYIITNRIKDGWTGVRLERRKTPANISSPISWPPICICTVSERMDSSTLRDSVRFGNRLFLAFLRRLIERRRRYRSVLDDKRT